MNYDSFCMAAAAAELRAACLGAFVDQVYQPEPLLVLLAFTGRGRRRFWLASADARWPRAHLTTERRENPQVPPGFCMLLRKHLDGARLEDVEQVRFDRILRLTFRRGEERRVLVHEVMGRHSNLALLDEEGTVLGAAKVVPPSLTRVRPLLPGQPYVEPPGARPDPRALDRAALEVLLADVTAPAEITARLSGWGTFAAREALARGPDPAAAVAELMDAVRTRAFHPVVFPDAAGHPRGVWTFHSVQPDWRGGEPAAGTSEACDRYYTYRERTHAAEALRGTLAAALDRALRTTRLQLSEAEAHLEGLDRAEQLRIGGELLSAGGHAVPRGAAEAFLPNWYDPEGAPLLIALDPELDARENAARYFHRYRRAVAAAEAALERAPALQEREVHLERLREETAAAAAPELPPLRERLRAEGLLREEGPAAPGRRAPTAEFPSGVRVRRLHVEGWEVLYGENATSNDYLTTRFAKPADLWLHARAVAGAHVVVRGVATLERLPRAVLAEAARIAAAHSEAKHSSVVAVDYTFRRYVRKPRGSGPGQVTYTGERTLHVSPGGGEL